MADQKNSYRAAGVDVEAGYRAVELIKSQIDRTRTPGVISGVGGFAGMFMPDISGMDQPVLLAATDGVGTKLKLAFLSGRHNTVGIDAVAMCVNDLVCSGAKPLFFLDYIACGRNTPEKIAEIVSGVAAGCVTAGCALIGGETAEHPGMMPDDEYDLAGFAVGIAERGRLLDTERVREGDAVIALASSGLHSNGFSLVRKVFDTGNADLSRIQPELGTPLIDELLKPTRIYVKPVLGLMSEIDVRGIAHITGGGFYENIPRCLPKGMSAKIERSKLRVPNIFSLLSERGEISERDMFATFNMGVGMVIVTAPEDAEAAIDILGRCGETAYRIGETVRSGDGVRMC